MWDKGFVCFKIEWPFIQTAVWEETLSIDSAFPEYALGEEHPART